jgi:hypothetical protein
MGIALFTISSLLAPLQGLVGRLLPADLLPAAHIPRRPSRLVTQPRSTTLRAVKTPAYQAGQIRSFPGKMGPRSHRTLPLRVVRSVDSGIPAGSTGRMVISGRMSDVCAELDRLAAMEVAP